jgi:N-acyl homoserine lactone hydrolase
VKHPDGEILVDTGASPHLDQDLAEVDDFSAFLVKYNSGLMPRRALLADALEAAGSQRAKLRILLTHAHPDHAGGVAEIPDVPVLLSAEELAFTQATAKAGGNDDILPAHARAMRNRSVPLAFVDGPYMGFAQSADLFHDGSVVAVALPGHTPGSIGVFVQLASGKRIFHIGDIALVMKSIDDNEPKGVLLSLITDVDRQGAADAQALVARVHKADPSILILPAHDREQWAKAVAPKDPSVAAVCAP